MSAIKTDIFPTIDPDAGTLVPQVFFPKNVDVQGLIADRDDSEDIIAISITFQGIDVPFGFSIKHAAILAEAINTMLAVAEKENKENGD